VQEGNCTLVLQLRNPAPFLNYCVLLSYSFVAALPHHQIE
jgi:hypothetical protein